MQCTFKNGEHVFPGRKDKFNYPVTGQLCFVSLGLIDKGKESYAFTVPKKWKTIWGYWRGWIRTCSHKVVLKLEAQENIDIQASSTQAILNLEAAQPCACSLLQLLSKSLSCSLLLSAARFTHQCNVLWAQPWATAAMEQSTLWC